MIANLALGLFEIHSEGIQHRDFKPLNILISEQNRTQILKITDFGLSKYESASEKINTSNSSNPTGTFAFNSPERFNGNPNSEKEDVWALGITAYYIATLELPFKGGNLAANMK